MKTVLIDIDGSVSGEVGKVLSWHTKLEPNGVNIFEAPMDYDFHLYTFEDGVFTRVEIIEQELT